MKKTYLPILLSLFLGFSCTSKEQEVQRISEQTYQIVSDSIYTRMPGKILYQDGIVFWEDPTPSITLCMPSMSGRKQK